MRPYPSSAIRVFLSLAAICLTGTAMASSSNKSIRIADGAETGGRSTVNGSITVGDNAVVDGSITTVNGSITVNKDSRVKDAETVNGSIRMGRGVAAGNVESVNGEIRLDENVSIAGVVSVVNGKITMGKGCRVSDDVSNVNGNVSISSSEIGGDLGTVNGDITLTDNSVLHGKLTVEKPGGWNWNKTNRRKPRVVIGPGVQVMGSIHLEREVDLFISETAKVSGVSGKMSMDEAVLFSGPQP